MTVTLDLRPEVQAELARQAAALGVGFDIYAANLLEEAARHPVATTPRDQIENTLRDLARFSAKIPDLPDQALTREAMYPDHA